MANVNRLKQVRMAIVNFEENFNYKQYYANKENTTVAIRRDRIVTLELFTHNCGTCACVAGFATALSTEIEKSYDTWTEAKKWLELDEIESSWLFTPFHSPSIDESKHYSLCHYDYQDESEFPGYRTCTQEQGYAEALRRLDHLIEYYSNNG